MQLFWQTIENLRLGSKKFEKTILQLKLNRENLAYIFCFFRERERKMKPFWPKMKKSLGPQKLKNIYFTIGIPQGKSGMHFLIFREKKENQAILTTNQIFSLGPKKFEKVLFYNWNSTGNIWHTFSCFWRKRKAN